MQIPLLINRSRQHQQLSIGAFVTPALELLQPITPVATAAQQAHHDQTSLRRSGGQVVVELGRMTEVVEMESPDSAAPVRGGLHHCFKAAEVGPCTGEKQNIRRGLLNEHHILGRINARATGKTVHDVILLARQPVVRRFNNRVSPSDASVPALRLVSGSVRAFRGGQDLHRNPCPSLRHRCVRRHARHS